MVTELKAACNLMLHYTSTSYSRIEDSAPPLWPSSGVNGLIDTEEYEAKIRSLGQQMTCYKLPYQLSGENCNSQKENLDMIDIKKLKNKFEDFTSALKIMCSFDQEKEVGLYEQHIQAWTIYYAFVKECYEFIRTYS